MLEEILDTSWVMIGTGFSRGHVVTNPIPTLGNTSELIVVDPMPAAGQPVTARILKSHVRCLKNGDWIRGEVTNQVAGNVMIATDFCGRNYFGATYPYDTERVIVFSERGSFLIGREFTLIKITERKSSKGTLWQPIQSHQQWIESRKAQTEKAAATRAAKKAAQVA